MLGPMLGSGEKKKTLCNKKEDNKMEIIHSMFSDQNQIKL